MDSRRVWLRSGKSANDDVGTVANKLIGRGSHRWRIGAKHITPAALVAAAVAIAICTWLLAPPPAEVQAQVLVGPTVSRVTPSAYRLSLARGTIQQFRVRATAGDRSISSWEWTLDGVSQGGQSLALTQSIERTFSHTFSTAGNYTVRASFTDTDGRRGANSWKVRVYNPDTPDSPRIVSMGCSPTTVRVEQVVSCRPSLSGGTPTEYRWGAIGGDPWAGTGQNFSTRWSSAGSKRVVLEVCNTGGCDTEEQYINVHLCFQHLGGLPDGRTDLSGSWNSACASTHRNGRYGRFYAFTLSERTEVQIDLTSSQDTVLYLLNGANSRGTIVTSDDDGGSGNNSRITAVLEAGTYTVEATTHNSRVTGDFRLSIDASAAPRNCFQHLGGLPDGRTDLSGSWNSACASTHRNGRYGRFYAFTLSERTEVQIDLTSSQDTVLYLLNGANSRGTIVTSDDDGGSGNNSRITAVLEAGTYTVEATTHNSRVTGDFRLSIDASAAPRNCFQHLGGLPDGRTDLSGSWNSACASTHRNGRYGRFYAFTLSERTEVQIDLTSSQDTVLYLLNGANSRGTIVTSDDDGGSGNNSRITTVLEAGTYTVEATTHNSRVTGDFRLSIDASAAPRNCFQHLGGLPDGRTDLSGSWNSACASTHRNGRYGRFYAFTLSERTEVQIDLTSSQDTVLYLLNGANSRGTIVTSDDDGGSGNNSRITTVLEAGTYTVEATTHNSRVTGDFRLSIDASAAPRNCFQHLGGLPDGRTDLSGSWNSACASTHRNGRYGRFYAFTLSERTEVQIDLTSSQDTVLYLLNGANSRGTIVTSDDDGGSGNNSRITTVLEAGTYTVEATTYNSRVTGDFRLSIDASAAPRNCFQHLGGLPDGRTDLSGSWNSACASTHRNGRYGRFYAFTLSERTEVQIDLTSSQDTVLYLLNGAGSTGTVVDVNDDVSRGNTDSRITTVLEAGTYTVEATTIQAGVTGNFTLTITPIAVTSRCYQDLGTLPQSAHLPGEWTGACASVQRNGSYGRFYTFELTQRGEVQIDLSSTRNAYLYLLSGAGAGGPLVASDNDGGSGNNSRITAVLETGTYTVEATTFNPGAIGTFDLRITSRPAPMDPCTDTLIASDSSVDTAPIVGEWTSDCSSEHRSGSYARYYTFTVASPSEMTITLESGFDTFLYLLEGAGTSGMVIASNNDAASGDTDSQLREFLSVGTYTIEATTYKGAVTGDFTLTVTAITVSQPPFEAPRNVLGISNSPGELTLSWGSADNPDSYLLIAVNMDTLEYETAIVSDGAARMGTVSGLTSGGSYLGIVVALKVTGGVVETPYGVATRVTVR